MCLKSGAKVGSLKISDVLFSGFFGVFQNDHIFFLFPSSATHLVGASCIGLKVFLTSSDQVLLSLLRKKSQLLRLGVWNLYWLAKTSVSGKQEIFPCWMTFWHHVSCETASKRAFSKYLSIKMRFSFVFTLTAAMQWKEIMTWKNTCLCF